MVIEHALITVQPGQQEAFAATFETAKRYLAASPGFRSARLLGGIEDDNHVLLLVEWDTLEDHLVGFRESPAFLEWRAAIGPHLDGAPEVEHFHTFA